MADTLNNLDVAPIERLAHGFRRTLFGFSPSFRRDSSQDKYGYLFKTRSSGSRTTFSPANRQLMDELGRTMIESSLQNDAAGFSTIDAGYSTLLKMGKKMGKSDFCSSATPNLLFSREAEPH